MRDEDGIEKILLCTRYAISLLSEKNYRRAVAANASEDRKVRAYMTQPTTVVKLLMPLSISGIPRPVGFMVEIPTRDAMRLVEQGKVEAYDF